MSLRSRLLVALGVLALAFAVTAVLVVQSQREFLTNQVDQGLERVRPLASGSALPPPPPAPDSGVAPSASPVSNLFLGAVEEDGRLIMVLRGELLNDVPSFAPLTENSEAATELERQLAGSGPFSVEGADGKSRFRVVTVQRDDVGRDDPERAAWAIAAFPLDEVDEAVARLKLTLALAGLVVLAALIMAFWWVQHLGLRPVAQLTDTAEAITDGDRSQRVAVGDSRTEAGRLAEAFNLMLDDRDQSDDRLRRFVADASHELRTPLASIRGYLDLYSQGALDDPQDLDDALRRVGQESARMRDLVEDLLLLANLDQQRPLNQETVDLGQILRDAALDAGALQPRRPVVVDVAEPLRCRGDAARLRQVVGILVDNALTHTGTEYGIRIEGSSIEDSVARHGAVEGSIVENGGVDGSVVGGSVVVVISDEGPGLSAEAAKRVFDRFYRGDSSRTRQSGGSGLGLAIAKSIAEAHGGNIKLDTSPGEGCSFRLTVPI